MQYFDLYSWFRPINEFVIGLKDGSVSVLIGCQGYDISMSTDAYVDSSWRQLTEVLSAIDKRCFLEVHFFRESDDRVAQAYLAENANIIRAKAFATRIREDIANHLAQYGRGNEIRLVLTLKAKWSVFSGLKKKLGQQTESADTLLECARQLIRHLNKGKLLCTQDYIDVICRSYYRDQWSQTGQMQVDPGFILYEQIAHTKPALVSEGVLRIGLTYTRVGILTLYPDAEPGWFERFASISPADVHVCQIIRPMDTKKTMLKASLQQSVAEGSLDNRGSEYASAKISDLQEFKSFVAANNLNIYESCYIIHLHHTDPDVLKNCWEELTDELSREGQLVSNNDVALNCFRVAQPGMGHLTPFFRPDHELEVANMMPMVSYDRGDDSPTSLRLTRQGQLVGFKYHDNRANHAFTVAKTGSGKGVAKAATILETFPLGTDWYIAEVGNTYQWVVEALGGHYCQLDPNTMVVNPFPDYRFADSQSADPLGSSLVENTLRAIRFLLLDEDRRYQAEELTAANLAMNLLYTEVLPEQSGAPNFLDFSLKLEQLSDASTLCDDQRQAAEYMARKLNSFLSTTAGKIFKQQDNFTISEGIFGVDFKPLLGDTRLMSFYLVFITLRFAQLCFANRRPSRILVDEFSFLSRENPELMRGFASSIARMGRKDAGALDLVTQSIADITTLDAELVDQMSFRNLLYTQSKHDRLLDAVPNINDRAFQCWKSYQDPDTLKEMKVGYREGMQMVGDRAWDLYMSFPDSVLSLANTNSQALALKETIGAQTKDPFERLKILQRKMSEQTG